VKAFILAGGMGTRLRPRFGDLPKPLAPLGGRPFLAWQLEWLRANGIRDAVLCAGYGAQRIQETLGDGSRLGLRLTYSVEPEPLGTGGALRLAAWAVDGPCLVLNGDTLVDCDPWVLERARWESGLVGTIALYQVDDASLRGRVECGTQGRVLRFVEKDERHRGPAFVNGGLYAFGPALWRHLPPGASSLERDTLPALAEQGRLGGVPVPGEFFDIGTPEEWERAERRFGT
jgi:NDP-sugar pyrophosphorylase family protein